MNKILVPTDFSKEAESALKVASQLAKKYTSEIYLLHMLEIPRLKDHLGDPLTLSELIDLRKKKEGEFEMERITCPHPKGDKWAHIFI